MTFSYTDECRGLGFGRLEPSLEQAIAVHKIKIKS